MIGFFYDSAALRKIIDNGKPTIYEVFAVNNENEEELSYAITVNGNSFWVRWVMNSL